MIRIPQVRVVGEDGSQLGVMPTPQALRLAQERGYDLVEVAPMASPPVVRLLDYGQFKYEQTRREKEARRHQRAVEFKEIRLTPKIGTGDFDTKVRRGIQFLEHGGRIKVTVRFRGRELTHAYLGRDLLLKFADQIREHGVLERQPLLEGKSMSVVIASTHKPKPQDVAEAGEEAAASDAPTPEAQPVAAAAPARAPRPAAQPRSPAQPRAAAPQARPAETRPAAEVLPVAEPAPTTEPRPAAPPAPRTARPPAATQPGG
jgi:translation initiation factor IF-3